MPNNKIVWNLHQIKDPYFTELLPKELPTWYSDRLLSSFYVQNANMYIIRHNHFYDKMLNSGVNQQRYMNNNVQKISRER